MDIEKIKSDLTMESFFFSECTVKRNDNIASEKLKMNIEKHVSEIGDKYKVELSFRITKDANDLFVTVNAIAYFTIECDDIELKKMVLEENTVAIMFPFVRSQVAIMTSQPNMSPIIIPAINTSKFK